MSVRIGIHSTPSLGPPENQMSVLQEFGTPELRARKRGIRLLTALLGPRFRLHIRFKRMLEVLRKWLRLS
jgi:hypothetical protein